MLTIDNKLAILDCLKGRATQAKLADEYGIGTSTVGKIKKDKAKIRSFASTMDGMAMSKKGCKDVLVTMISSVKQYISGLCRSGANICW